MSHGAQHRMETASRVWTPEMVATLKQLYGEGKPPSVIARIMNVTRDSVRAKTYALGLS